VVHKEQNIGWGRRLHDAYMMLIFVWCLYDAFMTKIIQKKNGRIIHPFNQLLCSYPIVNTAALVDI
jgi:hypothetical protein